MLANTDRTETTRIWLVDQNPFNLTEPPRWWQQLLYDYDKMLRIMPSQIDRAYRLCRVVRREARLGLQAMVIHEHPDTRACIKFGVVPVATLAPWAIYSTKVLRDLQARDLWRIEQGDPNRIADRLDRQEREQEQREQRAADEHLDAINSDSYRHVKYGYRDLADVRQAWSRRQAGTAAPLAPLPPLPPLPSRKPLAASPLDRVTSAVPPAAGSGDPAAPSQSAIVLTDR